MSECIKFCDWKIKTILIADKWFVPVRHIGIALGIGSDTLKSIVCHHLPQQYKFQEKKLILMTLVMALNFSPDACRVILGSTNPYWHNVIDFLVERHNYLQVQAWKAQKARHVALDDSIPTAKNYWEHIYFVFKLGEPALLGSKKIAYEYACISRYPWHI